MCCVRNRACELVRTGPGLFPYGPGLSLPPYPGRLRTSGGCAGAKSLNAAVATLCCLGAALARLLHLPTGLFAAFGFVGVVAGVPLGIILGRELWTLFARSIDAVPEPTVPVVSVVLVVVGALVFANLVATLPGRRAARTSVVDILRAP